MLTKAVAGSFLFLCAGMCAAAGTRADTPPDVAVAIHGSDATRWTVTAIGGRTIAGTYTVPRPVGTPDQGAFTWDGSTLRTYPVVDLHPGESGEVTNFVSAVNRDGIAIGANEFVGLMTLEGHGAIEIPARFAAGVTTFLDPILGGRPAAIDARGDIAGDGVVLDSELHAIPAFGSSVASIGAPVLAQAVDAHGNVAGMSSALRMFGNPFGGPELFKQHVFFAPANEPARDLGSVPNCAAPSVVGLADDGTIVGSCSYGASAWAWSGAFRTLTPLPGDTVAYASAISPDGTIVGTSNNGPRSTPVLWQRGRVSAIASLIDTRDVDFDSTIGISDENWILVSGKRGTQSSAFLVVPATEKDAAERIASLPPGPSPIPSGAPTPTVAHASIETPLPSAEPLEPTHVAAGPQVSLREIWTGSRAGAPRMASDGRRFYLAAGDDLQAFDAHGALVWKHAYRTANLVTSDGMIFADVIPRQLFGIDAETGAMRWSAALPDIGGSSGPVLSAGDGVAAASLERMELFDMRTGRRIASLDPPCEIQPELGGVFGCRAVPFGSALATTTIIDAATGKKLLSLPDNPSEIVSVGSSLYDFSGHVTAIHPQTKTFDTFALPGIPDTTRSLPSGPLTLVYFDGAYVISWIDGTARRYRLDTDPRTQHVVPFPAGSAANFRVGNGFAASAEGDGPLIVTSFDASGMPSARAYDGVRAVSGILIRDGLIFARTSNGVAIVNPQTQHVYGFAAKGCGNLTVAAAIGKTAAVGCQNIGAEYDRSRLTLIDLGAT